MVRVQIKRKEKLNRFKHLILFFPDSEDLIRDLFEVIHNPKKVACTRHY